MGMASSQMSSPSGGLTALPLRAQAQTEAYHTMLLIKIIVLMKLQAQAQNINSSYGLVF